MNWEEVYFAVLFTQLSCDKHNEAGQADSKPLPAVKYQKSPAPLRCSFLLQHILTLKYKCDKRHAV